MDPAIIKAELKAWEADFKARHGGREPGKADIKAVPFIDAKYKLYKELKGSKSVRPASGSTSSAKASSSRATSAAAPPLASTSSAQLDTSSVFKTPTKAKHGHSSTRNSPTKVTPSKSEDNNNSSNPKRTYVIANSPIKLRAAIASASAIRSSPNKVTRGHASANLLDASPRRHNNSFAKGGSGLDRGVAGSEDDDDLFQRGGESPLKKKSPARMIVDSDDGRIRGANIFSAGKTSRVSKEEERRKFNEMLGGEDDFMMEDDDEIFGPSPVKPSANGISKTFTPLFPDELSISLPSKPDKPTLFSTSIPIRTHSSTSLLPTIVQPVASSTNPTLVRSLKRPLEGDKSTGQSGASTSDNKGKGKAKVKAVIKSRQPKRTKFSELVEAEQYEEEVAEDSTSQVKGGRTTRQRNERGQIILEPYENGLEGEAGEPVVVYSRKSRTSKRKEARGLGEQEEDEDQEEIQDSLYYRSKAILSTREEFVEPPASHDEDSGEGSDASPRPTRSEAIDHSISVDSSIPSELVSMLSLRSSPIKKTSLLRERDRDLRVKKLLQEPSAMRKKSSGLADLEIGSEEDEGEGEGDDDWDSDAEGWKDLGDGVMDGYDDSS